MEGGFKSESSDSDHERENISKGHKIEQQSKFLTESKNASFLNHELNFFINNLKQKASESGLHEESLLP